MAITLATAGRSIFYSGVTVLLAMGVLTLLLARLMIVRSISLAVMVVAFTSLLAGLTLLPAILGILGHRIEWLRVMPRPKPPQPGQTGFWYRFSHAIMRRPWLWFLGSLAVLLAMAIPVKDISLVGGTTGALPSEVEAVRGFEAMNESFGANRLTPIQIVITTPEEGGVFRPDFLDGVRRLSEAAAADPRNEEVRSLAILARLAGLTPEQYRQLTPDAVRADPQRAQATAQFVNLNGGNDATTITVFSRYDQYDERHQQFVYDLRDTLIPEIGQLRGANVSVGGSAGSTGASRSSRRR